MTALPASDTVTPAQAGPHEPCVLLKLGEIVLKGKNRQQFERLLQNNIRLAVADLGVGVRLWQRDGVVVVNPADATSGSRRIDLGSAADMIAERMLSVMGVVRVCRAVR